MTTKPVIVIASNTEVDNLVFTLIAEGRHRSLEIGVALTRLLGTRLKPISDISPSGTWLGSEHANRSCQRLRKRGLVSYSAKEGWTPVDGDLTKTFFDLLVAAAVSAHAKR